MSVLLKKPSVLPGFRISLGFSVFYLSLVVLVPLSAIFLKASELTWGKFWETVTDSDVRASYVVSFGTSILAAGLDVVFGVMVAWVLARYWFFGKRVVDAMIDLPFALPTAVAGIALTSIYDEHGWIGRWVPFKIAFAPAGVVVALMFIGLPFAVRTLQPVIQEMGKEFEEAAASLGASKIQTFWRVTIPELRPAIVTAFALALARGLGEYGSVVFISGNLIGRTEIAPHQIVTKLEEYDYAGATAIAAVMLVASFGLLLAVNVMQVRVTRGRR
jgi:sulfate/thiosulfate transport system permease protein